MILLLDNFDSFTYNLVDYFEQLNVKCHVVRNNVSLDEITKNEFQALVISPGPETPDSSGNLMQVMAYYSGKIPILGICLGHQAIGLHYGAKLVKSSKPMHGKISVVEHNQHSLFNNIPVRFNAARYNSLVIEDVQSPLYIMAATNDGEIMAISHNNLPIVGLQYHPEAALTEYGLKFLQNWIAKLP